MSKSLQLFVAAGVGAVALGSAIYLINRQISALENRSRRSKTVTLRVKIPLEKLSLLIGLQGETIQEIRWKSKARIDFETDPLDGSRIAVIRGSPEETQLAEVLIFQILSYESNQEVLEINIPKAFVDLIIGANGSNLAQIKKTTNCDVSYRDDKLHDGAITIILRGKSNEISAAQTIIIAKIEARKISRTEKSAKVPALFLTVEGYGDDRPEETLSRVKETPKVEQLRATSGDGLIEILVSSVCDPFEFYVQIVGVCSVQLDKLVEDMTTFYEQENNRIKPDPEKIQSGDLIAARFSADDRWYRAVVVRVTVDSYDETKIDVDVDFVDFGDFQIKSLNDTAVLQPQFLKLNFQAIRSTIANIQPVNARNWTEQAIDDFERLTHAGSWKTLLARVVNHRLETYNLKTTSIPCLELIDASTETDINIANELVKMGHAVFSGSSSSIQTPTMENNLDGDYQLDPLNKGNN